MNNDPITLALDEALELTFPASDPIAVTPPYRAPDPTPPRPA
jgi:hypothetical protein